MLCNFTIITQKISSRGLINNHEQFDLNYSTNHFFLTKIYFVNTIHMNSKTIGLLFTANHPVIGSLCEPEFHSHFWPHTHHNTMYCTNFVIYNPNSPWTVTDCPHGFPKIPQLGSKIWNLSNDCSRPQTDRNIITHLNKV